MLGYRSEAWLPEAGAGLRFDDQYRLAHLPLVAPDHPLVIAEAPGRPYRRGRRPPITSLVLEVDDTALRASPAFDEMTCAIAASGFAPKICWPLVERRRARLHATVAGALCDDDIARLTCSAGTRALGRMGPVDVELRGLFAGRVNRGRIYLRAYPEVRDGKPAFAAIHDLLRRPPSDLVLMGLYNLRDELDPSEAVEFSQFIARWWDRAFLRWRADRLTLLCASDDLVLDSAIIGHAVLDAGPL